MELQTGKIYNVDHNRKGRFVAKVIEQDDTFVTLEITDGVARYHSEYDRGTGEELTVRKSLCNFTEYKPKD